MGILVAKHTKSYRDMQNITQEVDILRNFQTPGAANVMPCIYSVYM